MTQFNQKAFTEAMANAMAVGFGQKAPATATNAQYFHGPGGLFGGTNVEEGVLSTRITPQGLSQVLRAFPSVNTNPEFGYITGIRETDGQSEPATPCATCPSGETQTCIQTAPFGFICRETDTITPNRAVERINRNDQDMVLLNDMLGRSDLFQPIASMDKATIMQAAVALGMLEVGVLLQNKLMPMTWQGTPGNNNAGGGYSEFIGLDLQISTGKSDAYTNTACGALDSDVKDFDYGMISLINQNGFQIVRWMEALEYYVHTNAMRMHMMPVEWVYVMRPELWYELTQLWPLAYGTTRNITLPTSTALNLDGLQMVKMRDELREGMFLYINGRRHNVVLDDGIIEQSNQDNQNIGGGCWASNIYLVPVSYLGGRPATYYEYKDYRGAMFPQLRGKQDWWTDDGKFEWVIEQLKWCFTLSAKIEPRVLLRTPHLAGRINNVQYCPTQHTRQPFQDDAYFVKGGDSSRTAPSLWDDYSRTL